MRSKKAPKPQRGRLLRSALLVVVLAAAGAVAAWARSGSSPESITPAIAPTSTISTPPSYRSPEKQLDLPEANINYGEAALVVTRDYVPGYDVAEGLKMLDEIAARVRVLLARQPDSDDPMTRIAAINTVLFREYQFGYDLTDFPKKTPEKRLLGNLLRRGRGTCANLPDLYYAVAERLGFPIFMVEAPEHAFLRYVLPNGEHINIEATGGGGQSADDDYVAEMEIPKAALDSGTYMRTLSRREALYGLLAERAFYFDERRGAFEEVLREAEVLRKLRPNHAGTFWNSAVTEAIAGRATRELAKTDPAFAPAAEASFAQARTFAKRAMELGAMKPDNKGEYVERQEAIRRQRLGESAPTIVPPARWDALKEIEGVIAAPPNSDFDTVTAYRRSNPRVPRPRVLDPATEKELAVLREAEEVERYNAAQEARTDALIDALQRESRAARPADRMKALEDVTRLLGAPRTIGGAPSPSGKLNAQP